MKHEKRLFKFAAPAAWLLVSRVAGAQQAPAAAPPDLKPAVSNGTGHEISEPKPTGDANPGQREDTARSPTPSDVQAATVAAPPAAVTSPEIAAPIPPVFAPTPVASIPSAAPPSAPLFSNKLAIGKDGWLQVGALLQGWFDTQWKSQLPPGISYRSTLASFRARRAEIKLAGDIVHDVASFMVSFDPASTFKYNQTNYTVTNGAVASPTANTPAAQTISTFAPPGNTAALKLLWITLKSPYIEASIGQFKYPVSFEGQTSSAELLFPERAYSSRYFGDIYDMGLRLEKKFDWVKYQVFLLNGSGQNQLDSNLQKDLVLRVEVTPVDGLLIGATGLSSIGQRTTQATTKDNIEFFGRLNTSGILVQGELLWGEKGQTATGIERTKAAGRYATVGYTIAGKLQPVVRYGYLNTDKTVTLGQNSSYALFSPFGVATDEVRSYEVGLNYYLQGNELKLQAAYGYFDFDNIPSLQEFTFAAQAAF